MGKADLSAKEERSKRKRIDVDAARRLVHHYTSAAEASLQRRPRERGGQLPVVDRGSRDDRTSGDAAGDAALADPCAQTDPYGECESPAASDHQADLEGGSGNNSPKSVGTNSPISVGTPEEEEDSGAAASNGPVSPAMGRSRKAKAHALRPGLFDEPSSAAPAEPPRKRRKSLVQLGSAGQAKTTVPAATAPGAVTFSTVPPGSPSFCLEPMGPASEEERATAAQLVEQAIARQPQLVERGLARRKGSRQSLGGASA